MEHLTRRCDEPDFSEWQMIKGRQLPDTRPIQTDSTSCGIMTAHTILYYIMHGCLPVQEFTFSQSDVPALRVYMGYTFFNAISDRSNYKLRTNGERSVDIYNLLGVSHDDQLAINMDIDDQFLFRGQPPTTGQQPQTRPPPPAVGSSSSSGMGISNVSTPTNENQSVADLIALRKLQPQSELVDRFRQSVRIVQGDALLCQIKSTTSTNDTGTISMTTSKFQCLQPRTWLNDEVII